MSSLKGTCIQYVQYFSFHSYVCLPFSNTAIYLKHVAF